MLQGRSAMPLVFAHRGASAHAPQNTLAAFSRAAELGADGVELDVRRSADGVAVVMHDATVDATTNLTGTVDCHSAADLAAADAGWTFVDAAGARPFRGCGIGVPSLEAALDLCAARALVVDVEIKNVPLDPLHDPASTLAVDVARTVAARGETDRVFLSSFNLDDLRAVREQEPTVALALLTVNWPARQALDAARTAGLAGWHPVAADLLADTAILAVARASGCWVAPWTVNDPATIRRLAGLGVDALITDVPDVARRVLSAPPPGVSGAGSPSGS